MATAPASHAGPSPLHSGEQDDDQRDALFAAAYRTAFAQALIEAHADGLDPDTARFVAGEAAAREARGALGLVA